MGATLPLWANSCYKHCSPDLATGQLLRLIYLEPVARARWRWRTERPGTGSEGTPPTPSAPPSSRRPGPRCRAHLKVGRIFSYRKSRDLCWIFEIFSPKNLAKKLAFLTQIKQIMQNFDHNIGFWEKRQFFIQKLSKIAENCDHNIDPKFGYFL
jgi:hypothetical protein